MVMENNVMSTEELKQAWRNLYLDVKKSKKLKLEVFEPVFAQTYSVLAKYLSEKNIEKEHIGLIAEAFLFASVNEEGLDSTCFAAAVLTERMLNYCAFMGVPHTIDPSKIYVFEARKELRLDFDNVSDSVYTLSKVFEDLYWQKRNTIQ